MGGDKSVIDAGNKGGIHGLKSSLDSAIWGLAEGDDKSVIDAGNKGGIHGLHPRTLMLGTSHFGFGWGGGGGIKASLMLGTRVGSMDLNHHLTQLCHLGFGWGGGGGDKSVIDAGNKGGIHGLKSSLDSAIWGLVGGVGG